MSESLTSLLKLMSCLRDKESGCAWDLKQTYQSLAQYTLEEAYEVVDAIERENLADLKEELGDLLFQVVFQAQIANEQKVFDFDDVVNGLVDKMLRRHPHVFPGGELSRFGETLDLSDEEISLQWQKIKAEEKARKGVQSQSILDDVPHAMPSLMQAVKIQKKVAKVGFDWPEVAPVFAKIREELDELEEALAEQDQTHVEEEMGDVLFAMSNLSRHLSVAPDVALMKTNVKFRRRFRRIEELLEEREWSLQETSLEGLDQLWDQAKREGL